MRHSQLLFLVLLILPLSAQDSSGTLGEDSFTSVSGQFREIYLGMPLENVKEALLSDNYFSYRGEVEVTMFNDPNENIIDCRGNGFIQRAWFQFRDEKLFIMELEMDREKIDYFTIYAQLEKKYGDPSDLTPQFASWQGDNVELSLEYPLTVKYLDRAVFDSVLESSRIKETYRESSRKEFVEEF